MSKSRWLRQFAGVEQPDAVGIATKLAELAVIGLVLVGGRTVSVVKTGAAPGRPRAGQVEPPDHICSNAINRSKL